MTATEHTVLGIMSGSSLDGVDLAVCTFRLDPEAAQVIVDWRIMAAATIAYPPDWERRLRAAPELSGPALWQLHAELGRWIGERARAFLDLHPDPAPELVACHGHTVYHAPGSGYSVQLADGAALAAAIGLPVVTELRTADIAAGGQGAPIAPVADRHLYRDYTGFLNLGGIANFSLKGADGRFVAGDVSGCCQVLDRLAAEDDLPYDDGGRLASGGHFLPELAAAIEKLEYHAAAYPKSLGNDWVVHTLWPLLRDFPAPPADRLHTFCRWLAGTIADDLLLAQERVGGAAGAAAAPRRILVTGGGAHNDFLLSCLRTSQGEDGPFAFVTESGTTSDFKEAALIALCGLFRTAGIPNSFASATGAATDTINGALYLPPPPQPGSTGTVLTATPVATTAPAVAADKS